MLNFFQTSFFGLDLSDSSLKIAKLKESKGALTLASYGKKDIPEGVIKNGEIQKEEELIKIINEAIKNIKGKPLTTKLCSVSLPETKSFIRVIELPLMDKKELKEAIKWEAEANIPLPPEEIYLDWQIISEKNGSQSVLLGALPKNLVDSYLSLLKKINLKPINFEIESLAIARSIIKENFSEKPILIIDFGALTINLIIFYQSTVYFTATLPFGNNHLTRTTTDYLSRNNNKTEKLKTTEPVFNDLIKTIKDCLTFASTHFSDQISKVILCGGGSNLIGLPNFIYTETQIKTEVANPWINILGAKLKEVPELPYNESLSYVSALGLALGKPNFYD